MSYRLSNIVIPIDPSGCVLLLRRGPSDPWMPGFWNFPGGGQEESDRSSAHGAARELAEESGIALTPDQLTWWFSYRADGLVNVFYVHLASRPPVTCPDGEHDRYGWFAPRGLLPVRLLPSTAFLWSKLTGR